ncbi:Uncharacterised protein [Vibrio cholerae]|uniref:Uncharacterized protein n=1 Tax=Vibrio cholerae TaxID=666 RepID=A0A655TTI9_VIBCL|nr:Uncharacterised protein [Vibrio cholerae]CSB39375.1 Uncharacterised protein [Vibrio cholerae]CSB97501.1 Uncharacterised protein [Vibrio cholerae]CSC28960.1 Uncharacterised protein [Vibrio cholerae]CSC62141.1 Uncharacterised protein [Vibrio cholerae]
MFGLNAETDQITDWQVLHHVRTKNEVKIGLHFTPLDLTNGVHLRAHRLAIDHKRQRIPKFKPEVARHFLLNRYAILALPLSLQNGVVIG